VVTVGGFLVSDAVLRLLAETLPYASLITDH
jgi:hypothetical protein